MKDFPKPNVANTDNYRESAKLSARFKTLKVEGKSKTVAIIGGGLSGLAAARYLVDAGHKPLVLEAREMLGGKVSAWQDKDGDWIETGLHIFFGAYPNMMNLFAELGIEDRLQWKIHQVNCITFFYLLTSGTFANAVHHLTKRKIPSFIQMIFAMQELPGEFTTFDFIPGIPAPFNFGLAILKNQKMLTLLEKIQTAPPLIPMLIEGQPFIDAQVWQIPTFLIFCRRQNFFKSH
jgi:15-cis-phytoene desaturase